eukprot:364556-Chlamydomonas_euryale.AAC.18
MKSMSRPSNVIVTSWVLVLTWQHLEGLLLAKRGLFMVCQPAAASFMATAYNNGARCQAAHVRWLNLLLWIGAAGCPFDDTGRTTFRTRTEPLAVAGPAAAPVQCVHCLSHLQARLLRVPNLYTSVGSCRPNCSTWLVAGEIFPTDVRATNHGLAAALGKVGAIIASLWISYISDARKVRIGHGHATAVFLHVHCHSFSQEKGPAR